MRPTVTVLPDANALADAVAELFIAAAADAIEARGRFVVALAGGATPRATYERLAAPTIRGRVDWTRVHVVWGDERCVPPADGESNYRMARDALLDHVPVPEGQVHRMQGEADPVTAAAAYERELRALLATPSGAPRAAAGARIDLVLLGLGADGHTASLFPAGAGVRERDRWVIAVHDGPTPLWRLTLTPGLFNAAGEIAFVVSGGAKAEILRRVLSPPRAEVDLPAQAIEPIDGRVRWYVDAAAAADLDDASVRRSVGMSDDCTEEDRA